MRLDRLISTEWWEQQLTEEDLEEVRRETILSFDVDEAVEYGGTFIEYLAQRYRENMEQSYNRGCRGSTK